MPEPYLAELRIMACNFAPKGWALCNGQLLPINQNQPLFSLLGTTYGGNGQTTFGLPDLRGRVPMHFGQSFTLGERGGEESHTLTISELPTHAHLGTATKTNDGSSTVLPGGNLLGNAGLNAYAAPSPFQPLEPSTIASTGGSQAHDNMAPYLVLNVCIALQGVFPSHS